MIVGIDPGLEGAFAFLDPEALRIVTIVEMATMVVGKKAVRGARSSRQRCSPRYAKPRIVLTP